MTAEDRATVTDRLRRLSAFGALPVALPAFAAGGLQRLVD